MLQRNVQGLSALLFSLQLLPTIRYQSNSDMARELAENIRVCVICHIEVNKSYVSVLTI